MSVISSTTGTKEEDPDRIEAEPSARTRTAPQPRPGSRWIWRHRTPVLLTVILALASAVRLVNLNAVGFNSDEAVYSGQGASLAGNPAYVDYFPVFRAHPMLVQSLLSVIFRQGEHDLAGRVLIAVFGILTVLVVYMLGRELYSSDVGLLAAAILAVMPYHVVVTRQVLLDGPMVFFATVTLLWVAKFARTGRISWMVAAGGALGLTMLSKESSIVIVGGVYAFLALTPSIKRPVIGTLLGFAVALGLFALYPISTVLSGHTSTAKSYLIWQLVRRPNHGYGFYLETVPWVIGPLVLVAAVAALLVARGGPAWREILLASWAVVPAIAFTVWPVKGFQYLLPCAPAIAVLGARGLLAFGRTLPRRAARTPRRRRLMAALRPVSILAVLASLVLALPPFIGDRQGDSGLAGAGGVPGGRAAGRWVGANTPEGSVFMTLGPSMANIISFYGHRAAYGLSVSPNPLKRNPSYVPLPNPDASLRHGDLQYIVWDAYSGARSVYFSTRLRQYVSRYNGNEVHTQYAEFQGRRQPVVIIYEVRP